MRPKRPATTKLAVQSRISYHREGLLTHDNAKRLVQRSSLVLGHESVIELFLFISTEATGHGVRKGTVTSSRFTRNT
jgi:hypothetical protein